MNPRRVRELTRLEVRRSAFLLGRLYLLGVVGLAVAPPTEFGPLATLAPIQMALGYWVLLTHRVMASDSGCGL